MFNVDGYFVHLPGLLGDPDVRYQLTVAEALGLYRLLIYETVRRREDRLALLAIGKQVKEQLARAETYVRAWH